MAATKPDRITVFILVPVLMTIAFVAGRGSMSALERNAWNDKLTKEGVVADGALIEITTSTQRDCAYIARYTYATGAQMREGRTCVPPSWATRTPGPLRIRFLADVPEICRPEEMVAPPQVLRARIEAPMLGLGALLLVGLCGRWLWLWKKIPPAAQ